MMEIRKSEREVFIIDIASSQINELRDRRNKRELDIDRRQ